MNLKGQTFGRLTVIGPGQRPRHVLCQCRCGRTKEIRATNLTKKFQPTRSCGCYQLEVASRVGTRDIAANSAQSLAVNMRHNTNFQVIENPNPPKNNTSGHKGVSWDKRREKWFVSLNVHGKRISIGRFADYDEAVAAREEAEAIYYAPLIEAKRREQSERNRG